MKVLILDEDARYIHDVLSPKFPEVTMYAAETEDEVGNLIEEAEILLAKRISDDLLKRAARLEWIQSLLTGVDYILNLPSLKRGTLVTSTRGIHGPQVSELTFLLMLALNRDFPQVVRNQGRRSWERWPGKLLWKKTVAVLGVGVIGEEIARKCKVFGMTVYGIDVVRKDLDCLDAFYEAEDLITALADADYLINVVPSTPQTDKMIGAREFSAMKPTAYFINVGRGDTVDEEALVKALREGSIAGAGLDVFKTEPLPKDSPLWELDNVIVSPHVGGMSDIYADQAMPIFEENLRLYLKGERRNLLNVIDW